MRRFLLVVCLLAPLSAFAASTAVVQLTLQNSELSIHTAPQTFTPGDTLRIEIPTATSAQASTWSFQLGGTSMQTATATSGVAFEGTVPTNPAQGTVTFSDSANAVSMPVPIILNFTTAGAGGAAGAATPAPAASNKNVRTYDRNGDAAYLYFDANGFPLHGGIPRDIDDNDIITVFIEATAAEAQALSVQIEGTIAAGDTVEVLGSGSLSGLKDLAGKIQGTAEESQVKTFLAGTFGPFASPSITVKINKIAAGSTTVLRQYPVRINKTYVAAYRLMGINSGIRFNNFSVAPLAGKEGNFIQNTADPNGNTRYFLTVVPFPWSWRGRDISKPPKFKERLNPVIGVGLKDPSKEQALGFSFEISRALDVTYVWHHTKVKTLGGGYKEGDAFTGAAGTLPLIEHGESEWVIGVSLDLRVAAQMLTSILP